MKQATVFKLILTAQLLTFLGLLFTFGALVWAAVHFALKFW